MWPSCYAFDDGQGSHLMPTKRKIVLVYCSCIYGVDYISDYHLFQYFMKIVPTKVETYSNQVDTYQYSVTERVRLYHTFLLSFRISGTCWLVVLIKPWGKKHNILIKAFVKCYGKCFCIKVKQSLLRVLWYLHYSGSVIFTLIGFCDIWIIQVLW